MDVTEIPEAVRDRLNSQPTHPTYSDGPEVSLYLIVDGYLAPESAVSSLVEGGAGELALGLEVDEEVEDLAWIEIRE